MTVYLILSVITLLLTLFLGVYIFFSDKKNPVNKNFFLLNFGGLLWVFANFMADLSKNGSDNLFWSRNTLIGAPLVAYFFYKFSLVFPRIKKNKFPYEYIVLIFAIFFIVISPTKWNISSVYLENGTFQIVPGILYLPFTIYLLLSVLGGLLNLFRGYKNFTQIEKKQVKFIVIGMVIAVILASLANLILPLFGVSQFVSLGSYSILFFIVFTFYAIIKHNLFDVKVITTELFTFALWITLLVKIFSSDNTQDLTVNIGIFIAVFSFGILLIRGVLREVKNREEIERAYQIEKTAKELETKARKELERLDAAKNQFLMATQHHLRTPLTAMRGYVDLILTGTYGKVNPQVKDAVQKFEVSTKRLIKIVNELLDISQFQLGKEIVSLQPNIQIESLVKEVIEELKFMADTKKIYLKLEAPKTALPLIKAHPEKLKVALFNIIDNAIKYTKEGGVAVNVQTADHTIKIAVKDTGMGIKAEDLPTMFSRTFERGASAKQIDPTGRGIGMYITARIVEGHKGKIWAESEGPGKGSVFFVEIPVQ